MCGKRTNSVKEIKKMSVSFAEMFEESLARVEMRQGALLNGVVVDVTPEVVVVNAGLKSEGAIPLDEFRNERGEVTVKIGDDIEVVLEDVEDGFGETKLAREKAIRAHSWLKLETAFNKGESVIGIINGKVKGGFTVELDTIRAFLPGSLVDVRPVRETTHLEGKELEFKVIKLDQKRNNVVVSRRAVMEAANSVERDALLESLQEGMSVKGIVKNLTDYGAFVELGGVEGLLAINDMDWKRVTHASETDEVGRELKVKSITLDHEGHQARSGVNALAE